MRQDGRRAGQRGHVLERLHLVNLRVQVHAALGGCDDGTRFIRAREQGQLHQYA